MSSPPQLPPECIHLIAKHLHRCQAYSTLCTLLRTNKTIFALVAPIVFGEPFQQHEVPKAKLCRLLLSSRPVEQLSTFLQIAYFPEYLPLMNNSCAGGPLPSTSVNYSSFIKHLNFFCRFLHSTGFCGSEDLESDIEVFLPQEQFGHSGPVSRFIPRPRVNFLESQLRVDLTWALCELILEQIQSIDIPLSDIDRYVAVAHRFRSLSSVNFIIDFSENTWHMDPPMSAGRGHHRRFGSYEELQSSAFDNLLRFVDEIGRLFGSQNLRRVECLERPSSGKTLRCSPKVPPHVMPILTPLDRPLYLDESNWQRLTTHLDSTCLDWVETIVTPKDPKWRDDVLKAGQVWSQCRSLKELILNHYPTVVSFRWAVEEKNRRQGLDHGRSLAPLRRVSIHQHVDKADLDIDDIAVAFSDTLEELIYECNSWCNNSAFPTPKSFTAGYQWTTMPALRKLVLLANVHKLALDSALFRLCPALETVTIRSSRLEFDPASLTSWEEPVHLPHLTDIRLGGAAAQGFNMNTFASTPLVETISLSVRGASWLIGHTFDNSLPNSPHSWSWDWPLHSLSYLDLCPGFATFFEFRMLDHCPSLTRLILALHGPNAHAGGRAVHESDLFSSRTATGYLSCPDLRNVTFSGCWTMSAEVLRLLVTHVMPNASDFNVYDGPGCSTKDLVDACRRLKNLQNASLHVPEPTQEETRELGLVKHSGPFDFGTLELPAMFRFDGSVCYIFASDANVQNDVQ